MGVQLGVFLTYAGAILLIFIVGKLFTWPLKIILKLVVSSIIGGVIILVINFLGAAFGITIALNLITAVIVGVLGVPGVILLLIFALL